jgi:hypothetical protein
LLGCIVEASYGVLSRDEQQRLEAWLESLAINRRARRVFEKVMAEPGMQLGHARKKGGA